MSAAATRKPRISLRWPLIGLLLLIAATSGFLGLEASREATQPLPITQVAASHASLPPGTIERNGVRYRPIQTYQPCDRALGKNPELTDIDRATFGPEPDPATWKLLTLLAPKIDGSTADVEIVQPPEWLAEHNPQVGDTVPISVPECGIDGNAEVLAIRPCPPVKPGPGQVVLATFRHHVSSTVDVHVTGLDAPIGCTGNHPFWSEDRGEFVRADELHQGEHLSAIDRDAYVEHIDIDPTPTFVYNLMVQGEHVYRASEAGVLVHNGADVCHMHHTIPRGIQRRLAKVGNKIAKDPDIIGRAGRPNRKMVREFLHRWMHSGKGYVGKGKTGIGGGHYSNMFHREIMKRGGYDKVTKEAVLEIRDELVEIFGI